MEKYFIVEFKKNNELKIIRTFSEEYKAEKFIKESGSYRNIYHILKDTNFIDPLSKIKWNKCRK